MAYTYSETFAQMGCDFALCPRRAVGHAKVQLKNHSLGGIRDTLYLALCDQHILIGVPVQQQWRDDHVVNGEWQEQPTEA